MNADHVSVQSFVQDHAQTLVAGSAAVRAILAVLRGGQPGLAAVMAAEVAASLSEVCQRSSSGKFAVPHFSACPW